ncbi:peroxiredoxin-like family protein [Mycolicibacterium sp. 120266]|uniref:peroxiredoxin-like family protein n=1 Tax=Mycolicibacterium sp. 120266 TaxID=3090601 RepID=UPI00299E55EE|nr:peroxiredoxin-like family protein [Mycolicibacterium sp. 120266]MDX1873560.1 peroxiredoxin-like family protein [Mycolicibacterium sp. 120266]
MSIRVGMKFPIDVEVDSLDGPVTISQLLGAGPVIVAFHRMWCPFCQQAARDLVAVSDQLEEIGAAVVLVYREDVAQVATSCHDRGMPFHCVSDAARSLETAADVGRFSRVRYLAFSPARLFRALRSGSRIGVGSDFLQGRGTFVLDRNGRVVYAHRSVTAADLPSIADVVTAVHAAAQVNS